MSAIAWIIEHHQDKKPYREAVAAGGVYGEASEARARFLAQQYGGTCTPCYVSRIPPNWPTPEMIDAGAQRLVRWEDGCVWPDSWDSLQVAAARNEAERVLRSALEAAPEHTNKNGAP